MTRVTDLRCEYHVNPLGIDRQRPRLMWRLDGDRQGIRQTAFQIIVQCAGNRIWDSEEVSSNQSVHVLYGGPRLASRQRYDWRVRVWDETGALSDWSLPAWWEMGLLDPADWKAGWIDPEEEIDPTVQQPCPYLRRAFSLAGGPVTKVRAYVTSHGLYELSLNGRIVEGQILTPGFTSYHKRLQYQTYDLIDYLRPGQNVIGVILGDGWWRGKTSGLSLRNVYGERLALLLQLHVHYEDGREDVIISDEKWKTRSGPIRFSDMKDGEVYDARREMPGWDQPGFDDSEWRPVTPVDYGFENLVAPMGPPVRRQETFKPTLITTPAGETVLDFGQNLAGRVRFALAAPEGTTIRLAHGETLDKKGNFTLDNLNPGKFVSTIFNVEELLQEVIYTFRGGSPETYEPRFTFQGFRYVKVEGFPGDLNPRDFTAIAIYSDLAQVGDFECSHPLVTKLHHNITWSTKSNFVDIPTDCPHRERGGYTGDAQVFARTGSFIMETAAFFNKWLMDLAVDQQDDGVVPILVPDPSAHVNAGMLETTAGSVGWSDAVTIIPTTLYQVFGDRWILEKMYAHMKKWVDYMERRALDHHWSTRLKPATWAGTRDHTRHIWDTNFHFGEWSEPNSNYVVELLYGLLFPRPIVATAYYAYSSQLAADAAAILGYDEDAERYGNLAAAVKAAWQKEFLRNEGRISVDTQASYVRAIAFDLIPDEVKPMAASRLAEKVRETDYHIGTGFLSTPFICHVLTEYGYLDDAYRLLLQEERPSWLYPVTKGATTIWEFWDAVKEDDSIRMSSHNHYSPGSIGSWLYQVVAGIEIGEPGYKHIVIRPRPGGGLTRARATYESHYGAIASAWRIEDGQFTLYVTIPANTTAEIWLPDGSDPVAVGSGQYEYTCQWS